MDALIIIIAIVGFLGLIAWNNKRTSPPKGDLSREHIRDLILGKVKSKIYYSSSSIYVDPREAACKCWEYNYQFGKLFEMASKSPENRLKLDNGDSIAPHSRQHGLDAGKNADALRIRVIKEYGIDLATMEDLEADPATANEKKMHILLSLEDDALDNLPKKG